MGTTTQRSVGRSIAEKAAIAAKAKADAKAPQSQSDIILKPFIAALDEAIGREKTGRMALFDYAATTLAKAGKDKAFGTDGERMVTEIFHHWHRATWKPTGKRTEYQPLTKESLRTTVANWYRFYEIGKHGKVGFDNLAIVREAVEGSAGHVWRNAAKMMTYAVKQSKAGRAVTKKHCLDLLTDEPKTLEERLLNYAKSVKATVKSGLEKLDEGEEDVFPKTVLLLMQKAANAAEEEGTKLKNLREEKEAAAK